MHGVIKSAFGFAGQKCSACSRVLVLEGIADAFVERLKAAAASIAAGPGTSAGTFLPPVADEEALKRYSFRLSASEAGKRLAEAVIWPRAPSC